MATQAAEKQEVVQVRYDLPFNIHDKLKRYRRKISTNQNRDITMQDALIELINRVKL
jgi:hypothetical protein